MITTRASISINRPIDEVFAYICRLEEYPLWQSGLLEVAYDGPVMAGTKARGVSSNLGVTIEVGVEVIECTAPETLVFTSKMGPINFTVHFSLTGSGSKTKMVWLTTLETGRVYALAEPLIEHLGQVKVNADLKSLKTILETQNSFMKDLPESSRSQASR